jgi:sugar/nucleoside kinase (ribokinase family)
VGVEIPMQEFDIAFLGHYTKDTIVSPHETKTVHGGAFNYGARVAVKMGLRAAVIIRLAEEDFDVVEDLSRMGVEVLATPTPQSTGLKLVYPTPDLDQRKVYNVGFAGPFTPAEVAPVQARTFHIGASIRGEVPLEVIEALAQKEARISLDVQGFLRVKGVNQEKIPISNLQSLKFGFPQLPLRESTLPNTLSYKRRPYKRPFWPASVLCIFL